MASLVLPCLMSPVDAATFERDVLQAGVPVFVHVASGACEACPSASRMGDRGAWSGRARCYCLDAGRSPELSARYDVTHFPTILLFRGGKVRHRLVGPPLPDVLEMVLRMALLPGGDQQR